MNDYRLTFTIDIKGQDDPDARMQARKLVEELSTVVEDADAKLQQVYADKPPRKVKIA